MNSATKKLLIIILALQPLLIISFFTYYQYGYKLYGDPVEYQQKQREILQAIQDSLIAQQTVISPDTVGDSTMVALEMHSRIFEESNLYERQMDEVQTVLDSLQRERNDLESLYEEVDSKQAILDNLRQRALDEKITDLAKIYDGMKAPQSAPIFVEMPDTLAVLIITNMQERNASKLLGAIAETDIDKATRLTKLLAFMGVVRLD